MKDKDGRRHQSNQNDWKKSQEHWRFGERVKHGTHLPAFTCSPCVAAPMDLVCFALPAGLSLKF